MVVAFMILYAFERITEMGFSNLSLLQETKK